MRTASAARRFEPQVTRTPGGVLSAVVTSVEDGRTVFVTEGRGAAPRRATLAVAGPYAPAAGDTVIVGIVAGDLEGEQLFVLGVVDAPRTAAPEPPASAPAVATRDGVRAVVVADGERELLRVHDAGGRLLFEHDAAAGRTTLCTPTGDLELRADAGAIRLTAASSVEVHAAHALDLQGGDSVRVAVATGPGRPGSSVRLDAGGIELAAPRLEAAAVRADVAVEEGRLVAERLESTVGTLLQVVGALETRATRIVARAREMFTDVEGMAQTRAGRIRVVAADTFHLLGKRTLLKAEKDMKLKGEKIYLA